MAVKNPETEAIPREGYSLTTHASQQRRQEDRRVPLEAVNECIEQGEVVHEDDGLVALQASYGSVEYEAVVNPTTRDVVTVELAGGF